MKAGNSNLIEALKVLGTGKVKYIHQITLRQRNGDRIRALEAVPSGFMIDGILIGSPQTAFAVPAEELVGIDIEWNCPPEGVRHISSAIAHEKKHASK